MNKRLTAIFVIMSLIFCSCSLDNNEENNDSLHIDTDEFRAVWINYSEVDEIVLSSHDVKELNKNIEAAVDNCASIGLNRIILHVRAFSDAYYNSEIFRIADCMREKNIKDKEYDPLKAFCEISHKKGLKIDAWINPYRISYSNDVNSLPVDSIAESMRNNSDSGCDILTAVNGIFYNPASKKVQKLILDGIREIIENYPIDGIHIDDYFYPTVDPEFDKISYDEYLKSGGELSLFEWRRENVNTLVSQIYGIIKAYNDNLTFSVSPCGNIDANINEYFADVKLWCSQSGYADYVIPQAYYGFKNEKMPFEAVVEEWKNITDENKVKLCFGLSCYKCGFADDYAGSGKNEWIEGYDIISNQICSLRSKEGYYGFALYSYSSVFSAKNDKISILQLQNIKNVLL